MNSLPETKEDLSTASLEELRIEAKGVRTWCGSLFMQIKEWKIVMDDLRHSVLNALLAANSRNDEYVLLSNKVAEQQQKIEKLQNDIKELLDAILEDDIH